MKKTIIAVTVIFHLMTTAPSQALVFGDSNLSFTGYPDHTCYEPHIPYSFSDQFEFENFKREVENYSDCIKKYVEAAKLDKERITEKANEAVEQFNRFIDSIKR